MSAPAPAPGPSPSPAPGPRPAPKPNNNPVVVANGMTKARDMLNNFNRIQNFQSTVRGHCIAPVLHRAFLGRLVEIAETIIRLLWPLGMSQVNPVGIGNVGAMITTLARNYVHAFLTDLYVAIRKSALEHDAQGIFQTYYLVEVGSTGFKYDNFFSTLYSMMHPVYANGWLAEVLVFARFEIDLTRQHGNWFNIPNVAANELSAARRNGIFDVLERAANITSSSLKVGTKTGSGAVLAEYFDQGNLPDRMDSWLLKDNNFNDTELTVMYIIHQDIFFEKTGPTFKFPETTNENIRDNYVIPYYVGIVENEDTSENNVHCIQWQDANGVDVEPGTEGGIRTAVQARVYKRTAHCFRARVLFDITDELKEKALVTFIRK